MAADGASTLAMAVQRYGQVADAVNRRQLHRFIEKIRERWDPTPVENSEPRAEGYTDEGAFALCVYQLAFGRSPERNGQLCEAEQRDQVLLHSPVEAFVDEVPTPLAEPVPRSELDARLDLLRAQLQEQSGRVVQLPSQFQEVLSITNGINGAGVPSETANTVLVYPLPCYEASAATLRQVTPWMEGWYFRVLAAFEIGSCIQWRQIYYVLCYHADHEGADDASWRILDNPGPGFDDTYESLLEFLQHETRMIQERPGGARRELILAQSVYQSETTIY